MTEPATPPPYPFEIEHDSGIVTIADDWSGHVLIEQIYDGLRRARQSRDTAHAPPSPLSPGSKAEDAMIEAALLHGFQPVEGTDTYLATAGQIVALLTAARAQARMDALQDAEPRA